MHRPLTFFLVGLFAAAMLACGSSSDSAPLSIKLSPTAPTIAVNSSVVIKAQTFPELPKYYGSLTWTIHGFGVSCIEAVANPTSAPPMPGCSSGWLAYAPPLTGYTPTAVYYYPATIPGSFTVLVNGVITDQSGQRIQNVGSASAVVTVKAR